MYGYRTPGVYFEWQDKGDTTPAIQRTDIASFIGIASSGPLHTATKVQSWTQFESIFGGHITQGYLAYAVEGFFANGGRSCWVVRIADPATAKKGKLTLHDDNNEATLRLTATSPGTWSNELIVSILRTTEERFTLILRRTDSGQEVWPNLSMNPADLGKRYVEDIINDPSEGSQWVTVQDLAPSHSADQFSNSRTPNPNADVIGSLNLVDDFGRHTLKLVAATPGTWSQLVAVSISHTAGDRFSIKLRHENGYEEMWEELSINSSDIHFISNVINADVTGSKLVTCIEMDGTQVHIKPNEVNTNLNVNIGRLLHGADGLATLTPNHFTGTELSPYGRFGLATLESIDEVAIVAAPDIMSKPHDLPQYKPQPPVDCSNICEVEEVASNPDRSVEFPVTFNETQIKVIQQAILLHCELQKDRVAILDTIRGESLPEKIIQYRNDFDSSYGGLYFPWIAVPDPLRLNGILREIPPSGYVAGVYARGDLEVGVHKPPANQELKNSKALTAQVDDVRHADFNDAQVNVIRSYSGRGLRVSGARTLSSDADYKYVNVRRLIAMISEVIDERAQAWVFEANNHRLWRQIEQTIKSFLREIWQKGMLDGESEEAAFYTHCNEETNPQYEQDLGRVICLVGLNVPWPAEFVVIRIGFTESGAAILEGGA